MTTLATQTARGMFVRTAAPGGGALRGFRGCVLACLLATPALAYDVPSGQPVDLHEVLIDDVGNQTLLRFRFLAPKIARDTGDISYGEAGPDMEHLCETVALPYSRDFELEGEVVVISLADRVVEFGTADPEATQFFDAFRIDGDACIWEAF